MKILAIEHELDGAPAAQFQAQANNEARKVWDLQQAGIIRELYFRADRNEAVLILECDSLQEADDALACLPYVSDGLICFETIPLKPYPGFARLFAES